MSTHLKYFDKKNDKELKELKIAEHIRCAIDDFEALDKQDSALLHSCIAVDGTAKKMFPTVHSSKERFINCLRQYYWLIEPMGMPGINLHTTKWSMINLDKNVSPDFSELIYEVFRCNHAHGQEHPKNYTLSKCVGTGSTVIKIAEGEISFPDNIIFALISVAVLSTANKDETIQTGYHLTLGGETFTINDWWGREDDFREIAIRNTKPRIKIDW